MLDRWRAGDPLSEVAEDFGVPPEDVEDILRVSLPTPPEFFLDRSLGRQHVAQNLRAAAGFFAPITRSTVTETNRSQTSSGSNCVAGRDPVLTKDRRLRYRPAEIAAIKRFGVRAFVLTGGSLRATEQAARFDRSRARIEQACLDAGPFVFAVHANRIIRMFPAP